jgi:hypothetical protein
VTSENIPPTTVEIPLTVVTVLRNGRHLTFQTVCADEREAAVAAGTHLHVRRVHHAGRVSKFVVISGDAVTVEVG